MITYCELHPVTDWRIGRCRGSALWLQAGGEACGAVDGRSARRRRRGREKSAGVQRVRWCWSARARGGTGELGGRTTPGSHGGAGASLRGHVVDIRCLRSGDRVRVCLPGALHPVSLVACVFAYCTVGAVALLPSHVRVCTCAGWAGAGASVGRVRFGAFRLFGGGSAWSCGGCAQGARGSLLLTFLRGRAVGAASSRVVCVVSAC